MSEKAALRRSIRSLHGGDDARSQESRIICRHILGSRWYREAEIIGGYIPLKWEADVTPVLLAALESGKTLALPLCEDAPRMTLRRVSSLQELAPGAYGIPEPAQNAEIISAADVDLLLVPLEGIDPEGMRLGKGGGYYDCLLAAENVRTMGCALSWQWTDRVPAEAWDMPLDACADREGIRCFAKYSR